MTSRLLLPALALLLSAQAAHAASENIYKYVDRNGVAVDYFGRPAPSTTFPALLARSLGVRLYAARVVRMPGVRFRIEVVELPIPREGERKADVAAATQMLQSQFESWVRENPSQWMWAHRRWG